MSKLCGILILAVAGIQLAGCAAGIVAGTQALGTAVQSSSTDQAMKSASVTDVNMAVAQLPKPMTMEEFFPVARGVVIELKYQLTGSGGRTILAMRNSGDSGTLGYGRTFGYEQVRLTLNPDGTKVQIDVTSKGSAAEKADEVIAKFKAGLERPAVGVSKM